jgi:hypothetical protein
VLHPLAGSHQDQTEEKRNDNGIFQWELPEYSEISLSWEERSALLSFRLHGMNFTMEIIKTQEKKEKGRLTPALPFISEQTGSSAKQDQSLAWHLLQRAR